MASKPDTENTQRELNVPIQEIRSDTKRDLTNPKANDQEQKPEKGVDWFFSKLRIGKHKPPAHKKPAMPEDYPKKRRLAEETLPLSIPLVTHNQHSKSIAVNREAIRLLRTIAKPVAVLSICGPYRTGKSYFLSQVLGGDGFKVSHSMDPCTRGIWMSTTVLEFDDHILILLDTEGIGAPQASETFSGEEMMSILVLVTLLSSCLIYNTKGAINESDVQKMSCFAKLSQSILISESLQHDGLHESYLKKQFPHFLWLMRDSDFESTDDNGEEMSTTDYVLQKILVTNYTGDQPPSSRDRAVSSVRAIFPQIKCLAIPSPGPGINPNKKKTIDRDFETSIDSAKQHVVSNTPVKLGFNGSTVLNGPMLAALLDEYVQALNIPGTIPNLEVSYQKVVEVTLTKTTLDLAENYRKQMTELLDQTLPLEEGDIEALKQTHSVRLEESLNGDILKTHEDTIESVKKTDTLFEVHERVYTNILREFIIELHQLIPETADTDEILLKNEQARKRLLLEEFEQLIIKTDQSNVLGGYISHFTKPNTEKSKITCGELFETIYKQQIETGVPERKKLEAKYYEQAIGPAKDQVFQEMISQIPGPPQNVTMNLEQQTLFWEKPLVNADDVNFYYIEWNSEGEDPKRDKAHTNHFKLKMLKPKTNYSIKVQGLNDHKNRFGEYCTVVTFQTRAGKPEMPKMPKVSPQTKEKVKLTITMLSEAQQNGSPVTKIIVSRCSDKNSNWESQTFPVLPHQGEFQTPMFQVNCKDNEEVLHFRVQFENEAGVSEPSDSAEVEIADMIPGKPNKIITIISMARQIQVTWDPPINNPGAVNSYLIQYWKKRDGEELFQSKSEKIVGKNERSQQLTPLSPFTAYIIRIYARNEKNKTDGYSTAEVQTPADVPDEPRLPTIRVTSASEATITFYRQKPSEENGNPVNKIYIERQIKGTEQAMNWTLVKEHPMGSSQSDVVNVNLPNLTEPSISCYRVVSVNSVGRSKPSQPVEVHPEDIIPGSPEGLKEEETESNFIKIAWNKPKVNPQASKRYQIQHKQNVEGATWTTQKADTPSCSVSELRPNTKYKFIVQTLNGLLMSEEAPLLVCTPPSVPPKPERPRVFPIPNKTGFTLNTRLPLLKESGRKVIKLHVNYYGKSWDGLDDPIETGDWPIEAPENKTHKQEIQVNIDTIGWIGIRLSNSMGKSQESDLLGISSGDVTPGEPHKLVCTPEARSVTLSWNIPKINGNAAKYYEVLIIDQKCVHVHQKCTCKILENVTLKQRGRVVSEPLSYEATVNDLSPHRTSHLSPFTTYHFGVRAVNNTTCKGDIAKLEITTKKARPDKPDKPITVEPITGEPSYAELELKLLEEEKKNGGTIKNVIIECECNEVTTDSTFPLTAEQQKENKSQIFMIKNLPNLEDSKIRKYSFRIRMESEEGKSPPSDAFMLPVSKLQLGSPTKLEIPLITAHTLKVQWEKPASHPALVTHYDIEYTAIQHNKSESIRVKSDVKEYTISKLRSKQDYCIKVNSATATKCSEPMQTNATTEEIYPGAPSYFFTDKINTNCVKVRWGKPNDRPEEVHFYKVTLKDTKANKVILVRRTLGHSTVFKKLNSWKTYTASLDSYNDNKKKSSKNVTLHIDFDTKMRTRSRVALQVLTAPTIAGPTFLGNSEKCDENIYPSDDEFKDDTDICPSAPMELNGKIIDSFWNKKLQVTWKLPNENDQELDYFEVKVIEESEEDESKPKPHIITSYETSETFILKGSTKQCTVTVTSFNCSGKKGYDARKTISVPQKL